MPSPPSRRRPTAGAGAAPGGSGARPARHLRVEHGLRPRHAAGRSARPAARRRRAGGAAAAVCRSLVRVSSLSGRLFLHSAYPTEAEDSVFFGPDTYRFARFVEASAEELETPRHLVDLGAGAGPAGSAPRACSSPSGSAWSTSTRARWRWPVPMPWRRAWRSRRRGRPGRGRGRDRPHHRQSAVHRRCQGPRLSRRRRDAGRRPVARLGAQSLERLSPGGTMLLYTGSPIIAGEDRCCSAPWPSWPRKPTRASATRSSTPTSSARSWSSRPMPRPAPSASRRSGGA
jgi:hypothetical protein